MEKDREEILNEQQAAAEELVESSPENGADEGSEAEKGEGGVGSELQEANEKYMRLAAEYQNFRRRTETEKQNIASYANERIAKELLDVVDNFERALASAKAEESGLKNGVDLIYKQLLTVLKNFGVEPIDTKNKEFDPNFHNAVMSEAVDGTEAGMILAEMQKGYMLRDRVLRPSMVKVSV